MKYILIDTNIWRYLLNDDEGGKLLHLLEQVVNQGLLTILVPDIILDKEWPKMEAAHQKDLKDKLRSLKGSTTNTKPLLPILLDQFPQEANDKISSINSLINNGIRVHENKRVTLKIAEQARKRKAPFHYKGNNFDDASIYYSAIDYLIRRKIPEFIFVTNNTKDFSDPSEKRKLHPDLQTKGLIIQYDNQLYQALNLFRSKIKDTDIDYSISDFPRLFYLAEIDKDMPLIKQLYDNLDVAYSQLKFIPLQILPRIYPFKINDIKSFATYYSGFTLCINNKELVEVFRTIDIKGSRIKFENIEQFRGVRNYRKIVTEVYESLNRNLVTEINHVKGGKSVNLFIQSNNICECIRCKTNRLDYLGAFQDLNKSSLPDINGLMKEGYAAYHLGSYKRAFSLFHSAYKQSENKKKHLLEFICFFNLKLLRNYIRGIYLEESDALTDMINEIDNKPIYTKRNFRVDLTSFELENIQWLMEEEFYKDALKEVSQLVKKIRDHYYTQLAGGWSSNSHLRLLICKFAEFEQYLDRNFILYHSQNITEIFEIVLEGILMSYMLRDGQGSKLEYFNDFLLLWIIRYTNPDTLLSYLKRFKLSNIIYKPDKDRELQIETIVCRFLASYTQLQDLINDKVEENEVFFLNNKIKIFLNILTIVSISNISKGAILSIAEALLQICSDEKPFRRNYHKHLAKFLSHKGKFFNDSLIRKFTELAITCNEFHDSEIFGTLKYLICKYFPHLKINERDIYKKIVGNFIGKCPKCNAIHDRNKLVNSYFMLSNELKEEFKAKIKKLLRTQFDKELYYLFAIHDIIDYSEFWEEYKSIFEKGIVPKLDTRPVIFPSQSRLNHLNEFLNMIFKNKIKLEKSMIQRYEGLSLYYDWLLDMENFNYVNFQPSWILEYPTEFYFKKIFACAKVTGYLKKYLIRHNEPNLSELYIRYSR